MSEKVIRRDPELQETVRQLTAANEDLRRMTRLHALSTRLNLPGNLRDQLDEILGATMEIVGADMGDVQLFEAPDALTLAAQSGFAERFVDFFAVVHGDTRSPCGAAMSALRRVTMEDITAERALAGSRTLDVLVEAGVRAAQSTPLLDRAGQLIGMLSTHYRQAHRFADAELRWLDLLAREAADAIVRHRTEELLARATDELESRVADRTRWLALMHDVSRVINEAQSWDDGLRLVLRAICERAGWQLGYVYLPDSDDPEIIAPAISCILGERFRPFHVLAESQRYARGQNLPARVYAENTPVWLTDPAELTALLPVRAELARQVGLRSGVALPIRFGRDVIAVLELFSEELHRPNDVLADLMNDVSTQIGRVLEREQSTAQTAELVWREQQDLLHTLHDSLGQTLTALAMLSTGLRQQLAGANPPAAEIATRVAEQAQLALDQVRQLSRGLFPLEIDPGGLEPALRDLASTTEAFHRVRVRVTTDAADSVRDARTATQLYRIGQEAVTNAVKHARARTIRIELAVRGGGTRLKVVDDGIGFRREALSHDGLGLRIMRYRAASIGAILSVERAARGGTVVTCTQRDRAALRLDDEHRG
jgi:signal transduction histidine kinase